MHELGIVKNIVGIVEKAAVKNRITAIKSITLEIGRESGVVPGYMNKLFPMVAEAVPVLKNAELIINTVVGRGLIIKEIGY